MKTLEELRYIDLDISKGSDLVISRLNALQNKNIDYDVYLPSKGINLQRDHVWTREQKSELIMSILMERSIPPVSILSVLNDDETDDDILQVIDGKQRLSAMSDFYHNRFPIKLEGKSYKYCDLPDDYQRTIAKYPIRCKIAYEYHDAPISDQTKIDWFKMINFAGTPQDAEHMEKLNKD